MQLLFYVGTLQVSPENVLLHLHSSSLLIVTNQFKQYFLPSGDPRLEEKGGGAGGRDHATEETDQSTSELTSHSSFL